MTKLTIQIVAACLLTCMIGSAATFAATAEVKGIVVIMDDFPETIQFRPFNNVPTGTSLAVLIDAGGKQIVKIDVDASRIRSFTDDKGTDLTKKKPQKKRAGGMMMMQPQAGIGSFPKIGTDRKFAAIEITGPTMPARGAKALLIDAELIVSVGKKTKTTTVKNARLKPGKLNVPGHRISIDNVGKPDWGEEYKLSVTFAMTAKSADMIVEVVFLDAANKKIKSQRSGSMRMGNSAEVTFNLPEKLDSATIKFVMWDGLEQITIPLKQRVGLGLSATPAE
jgi:hypothetical protein